MSNHTMPAARHRETLSEQLTHTLSERISAGVYPVGSRLPSEQEMIGEFGVSRTVVREAIANLKSGGRITIMHGVGAFVMQQETSEGFQIDAERLNAVQEMVAVLELRIALESEAALLAAQRRTPEQLQALKAMVSEMGAAIARGEDAVTGDLRFHQRIAEAAGNRHFLTLFNYLGEMLIPRARLQAVRFDETPRADYLARVQREHEQICYAIEIQDAEAARAAIRMHLASSKARLQRSLTATKIV